MHNRTARFTLAALALVLILTLNACAKPQPAGLTDAQVSAAAENILQAVNTGDYAAFTRDFSPAMLEAFPESALTQLHDLLQQASGNYVSLGTPTLLNQSGYAVYRFPCQFEKENVIAIVTFAIGGTQVEGLFFDSTNLRATSK